MGLIKSWVTSANNRETDFPLNNLPYGVFSVGTVEARCGVAIGDMILDVTALEEAELLRAGETPVFDVPFWNDFMDLGPDIWAAFRRDLTNALRAGSTLQTACQPHLVAQSEATLHMPFVVSEFTDFYASKSHAQNMGDILRGSPDLPANWLHVPIGYNGRASSVVVSGTDIRRPLGQAKALDATVPSFGPSTRLDFELEMGAIVGTGSVLGQPVSVAEAERMIFGFVLLNDWSARDIQAWEYQPLGPFQGKAFATSISPWIVTVAALQGFRAETPPRVKELLPYLNADTPGLYDISLEVLIQPQGAAQASSICKTNMSQMYYSPAQQLCHHSIGGCEMNAGDLLGTGTISGPNQGEFGSLMELSRAGREPITLETDEQRAFIQDGDTVTLRGAAIGDDYRIGFGDCAGKILPAIPTPDWAE